MFACTLVSDCAPPILEDTLHSLLVQLNQTNDLSSFVQVRDGQRSCHLLFRRFGTICKARFVARARGIQTPAMMIQLTAMPPMKCGTLWFMCNPNRWFFVWLESPFQPAICLSPKN